MTVFRHHIAEPASTRVLAYVNLSTLGSVIGPWYGRLSDPRLVDEDAISQAIETNRDMVVGIKVMATGACLGLQGLEPLRRARKLADRIQVPLLVHIGESWGGNAIPPSTSDVVAMLNQGDTLTHMFTAHLGGLLDKSGKLWPEVKEARNRGVFMDVGHGLHNMNFDVASRVLDQGLLPDTLSTDGHRLCREGPVYDLPTTMAKLMALGFSLPQVVEMATTKAAKLLGRFGEIGTLAVGRPADISILKLEEREWFPIDSQNKTLKSQQILVPVLTIRNGILYDPIPIHRP